MKLPILLALILFQRSYRVKSPFTAFSASIPSAKSLGPSFPPSSVVFPHHFPGTAITGGPFGLASPLSRSTRRLLYRRPVSSPPVTVSRARPVRSGLRRLGLFLFPNTSGELLQRFQRLLPPSLRRLTLTSGAIGLSPLYPNPRFHL